jgi:hypothetical protein
MNEMERHLGAAELVAGLDRILASPKDEGLLELIVRRPGTGQREAVATGELTPDEGLVGDGWRSRMGPSTRGKPFEPDTQITLMNSRVAALVAQDRARWALAGDQLFVDLDLSEANLPPGTRLAIGTAVLEVAEQPHTGCRKFVDRFGQDAMKFVNSAEGRALHLRGLYAKVVTAGTIRVRDRVSVLRRSHF